MNSANLDLINMMSFWSWLCSGDGCGVDRGIAVGFPRWNTNSVVPFASWFSTRWSSSNLWAGDDIPIESIPNHTIVWRYLHWKNFTCVAMISCRVTVVVAPSSSNYQKGTSQSDSRFVPPRRLSEFTGRPGYRKVKARPYQQGGYSPDRKLILLHQCWAVSRMYLQPFDVPKCLPFLLPRVWILGVVRKHLETTSSNYSGWWIMGRILPPHSVSCRNDGLSKHEAKPHRMGFLHCGGQKMRMVDQVACPDLTILRKWSWEVDHDMPPASPPLRAKMCTYALSGDHGEGTWWLSALPWSAWWVQLHQLVTAVDGWMKWFISSWDEDSGYECSNRKSLIMSII